jgi:outer membrane protein OmpA-like peptidoglycan-associated protein
MKRALMSLGAFCVVWGCGTLPKPQELTALEELRKGEAVDQAKRAQAQLYGESEAAYKQATEAWEDGKIEAAKHWSTVGAIKLRTAFAIIGQESARRRVAQAQESLKQTQAERASLESKIAETNEKIKLTEQLTAARKTAREKESELTQAQQLAEAEKRVSKAQLALKLADTVEAAKYAAESYSLAQALLDKASASLKAGGASDAASTADLAQAKADTAYQAARPQYLQAKQTAVKQAETQALQKDAAAINGITVKLSTVGQTQQLTLPVYSLFKRNQTTPLPDKVAALNAIGELLKKYPSYPVIINGYTSYLVRESQRYSISQARAQQVANHFTTLGVPLKRFAVAGLGAENLFARRHSPINDRVEIVFLFQ